MMRPRMVRRVAAREILSTLRDRRAIVSNLLIPLLLLPGIMLGLPLLLGGLFQREAETVTALGAEGLERMPSELVALIEAQQATLEAVASAEEAVRDDEVPAAIVIPEGFGEALAAGERVTVAVVRKTGNIRSELNAGKLEAAVAAYRQGLVTARLTAAGLDPTLLEPVTTSRVDASTEAERASGQLAWLIPFFIAIWTLAGGQMAAIDATAGEKERGTLEVLLVAPVRRVEVLVGKFLATALFGLTAAFMAIVGFMVGGLVMRGIFLPQLGPEAGEMVAMMGGVLAITPVTILLLLVSALLLAGVVAALLISVTLFARSFKEAQTYVAPLSFLLILPVIGLQFRDLIGTGDTMYWIPVLNAMVLMDDAVRGAATTGAVAATWLSLLATIVLLLTFAYRSFGREDVLFRT
jgi:sodium transport system permease protein